MEVKKKKLVDDVFVIIRSAGESTKELCYSLLKEQVGEGNLTIIQEKPFVEAVRKTFELGLRANKKWTLAIDADVLIKRNAVIDLLTWANGHQDYFFEFQGRVVDRFFCAPRPGGPHLYRTKYLEHAIKYLPTDKNALRPESYTYQKMADKGYHYFHHPDIYGIHDYFQHPRDIYRKAFLHAHKHNQHIAYFVSQWAKFRENDPDYRIALQGLIDGLSFNEDVEVNIDFFKGHVDKNLKITDERSEVKLNGEIYSVIDEVINNWNNDSNATDFEKKHLLLYRRSDHKKNHPTNFLLGAANIFLKVGQYLKRLSSK